MSTIAAAEPVHEIVPEPPSDLIEEDGIPLESDWHRLEMTLLIELVVLHLQGREDFFVGGNMFIYFNRQQARDRDFRGPDFFFVWDVPLNPPRPYWAVWDEGGKYPDVIIELASPSTVDVDHGIKKTTYERTFHTREYFIYDPDRQLLQGWRLNGSARYQEIEPNEQGWLWCDQLQLWLGTWSGKFQGKQEVYLRFFDKDGNLIATANELASLERINVEVERRRADEEKRRADMERQQAEKERQQAENERERAEKERQKADAEKQRADAAEAELKKLKARKRKPKS
jgi:Uma2 family endonuclease